MEVVILGCGAMEEFLGRVNLEELEKFVKDQSNVTAFHNSLLPKFSINAPKSEGEVFPGTTAEL